MVRYAGIEGGGTTWVVAIAEDDIDNIVDRVSFETTTPGETLAKVKQWLQGQRFDAIGVATFGPVDAKEGSDTFGFITSTPKPGWMNTDVLKGVGINDEFSSFPFQFDTDVNAPALAEFKLKHSSSRDISSCAYITVGTGVGVGLVVNGQTVKGLLHPEAGHLQVKRQEGDTYPGRCPFHGDCIEGMISSGALAERKGCDASELANLSDDDPLWDTCAYYLGQLCADLLLIASPEHIVIGGGVLNRTCLYEKIQNNTLKVLNKYICSDKLTTERISQYITASHWGNEAGLVGSMYLAKQAYEESLAKK